MYARGLTTRQISEQIEDIYGLSSGLKNILKFFNY